MKNNQKYPDDHEFEPSKPVKKAVHVFQKMRIIGLALWFAGFRPVVQGQRRLQRNFSLVASCHLVVRGADDFALRSGG